MCRVPVIESMEKPILEERKNGTIEVKWKGCLR